MSEENEFDYKNYAEKKKRIMKSCFLMNLFCKPKFILNTTKTYFYLNLETKKEKGGKSGNNVNNGNASILFLGKTCRYSKY